MACRGQKGANMCSKTKDELIAEVQALQENDDEVYAVLERYYDKYDLSPKMSDLAARSGMISETEVRSGSFPPAASGSKKAAAGSFPS